MTDERLPPGQLLAATARWAAAVRAKESARDDRLFEDPWAAALAGPEGQAWIEQRRPDLLVTMTLRTRFFDDWLRRVAAGEAGRQVVLVAAGLDTRAFRLDWPAGATLFELDRPEVLDDKERVLRAAGARARVGRRRVDVDLTAGWTERLLDSGFDPRRASSWLLEGLLFYLPAASALRLLDAVSGLAAPASAIGFDCVNSPMLTSPWTRAWVEMQAKAGAPWLGTFDDPLTLLAERGWSGRLNEPSEPQVSHGRWTFPVFAVDAPGIPHVWFVTGTRPSQG
jgi:methyltransferase (TIGR00027 family)